MKYNLILIIVSLLLLSVSAVFDVNYLNYKVPVPYSGWKTITFYDFKGYKKPGESLFGNNDFAFIKTSTEISLVDPSTAEIITYFHPSRSYVFSHQVHSPELLKHELYHFHITEYCARLLRKDILDLGKPLIRSRLNKLKRKYRALENDMQYQYDDESYHSYVLKEQKKWENRIDSGLIQLKAYSDPIIHLKED